MSDSNPNGWDTTAASEFKVLAAGSNIYYTQVDNANFFTEAGVFDTTKAGFQLTIGWNSTSGAPAAKQGADYTYKCDYSALYTDGTSHPCFDAPVDGKVELYGATAVTKTRVSDNADELYEADPAKIVHYQTFAKQKAAPVKIDNYVLKTKIGATDSKGTAKPTWVKNFFATGSYDSWAGDMTAGKQLVADSDGYYSINMGTVYADVEIEYMIVCTTINAAGEESSSFWANKLQKDNLKWTPGTVDEGVGVTDEFTWTEWPADPDAGVKVTINLTCTDFPTARAEGLAAFTGIGVKGDFDGWSGPKAMTLAEGVWSYAFEKVPAKVDTEFGFVEYVAITDADADMVFKGAATGNLKVTVASEDITVTVSGSFAEGFAVAA